MDVPTILAINLMAISAVLIGSALIHRPPGAAGWIVANLLVIATGLLCLRYAPSWSAWATAATFVPLIATPLAMTYAALYARRTGKDQLANTLARGVTLLHPSRAARFQVAVDAAASITGHHAAVAALTKLLSPTSPDEKAVVQAMLAAEHDDWQGVLSALRSAPSGIPKTIAPMEIRALGELGRIDEMAAAFEAARPIFVADQQPTSALFLYAFSGQVERARAILSGPLRGFDDYVKAHWLAVARLKANPVDHSARDDLARIATTGPRERGRLNAARHLSSPERGAPIVSAASIATIDRAEERPSKSKPIAVASTTPAQSSSSSVPTVAPTRLLAPRIPLTTYTLILANIFVFLLSEFEGGSENLETLVRLGALWQPLVTGKGEWWRLLTATFLHYGMLHLAMNMLFLFVVGRTIEQSEGPVRTAILYLICAIASTAIVCALMWSGMIGRAVLVGASGALFGFFGIEAANTAARFIRTRSLSDRSQLLNLALLLGIQVVVDVSIPNISIAAHVAGFCVGIVLALILLFVRRVSSPAAKSS